MAEQVKVKRQANIHARRPWLTMLIALACGLGVVGFDQAFPWATAPLVNYNYDLLLYAKAQIAPPEVDPQLVFFKIDRKVDKRDQFFGNVLEGYDRYQDRLTQLFRVTHSQLLPALREAGAERVVFDVLFVDDTEVDGQLVEAMRRMPSILLVEGMIDSLGANDEPEEVEISERFWSGPTPMADELPVPRLHLRSLPHPKFVAAAAGGGHGALTEDRDGQVRRIPLVVRLDNGRLFPSLTLAAVLDMYGVAPKDVSLDEGYLVFPLADRSIQIPLDANGFMFINYIPDWLEQADNRSYFTQWEGVTEFPEDFQESLGGKTILVGATFSDGTDFISTPLTPDNAPIPGAMAHFNAINTIITGQFITPAPLRMTQTLTFVVPLVLGLVYLLRRPMLAGVTALVIACGLLGASWWLFNDRWYFLPVALPLLSLALTWAIAETLSLLRALTWASRLANVLKRFVSPALLEELYHRGLRTRELAAQRKELTVMFADIEGFTSFSESADLADVSRFMKQLYERGMNVLIEHHGTLDKFLGDGILAYFGAPVPVPDKERWAVAAALALQEVFNELAEEMAQKDLGRLQIRCGITTGEVTVGYMGGRRYADYTIIGRFVNMAARLEQNADPGHILIDQATADGLDDQFELQQIAPIHAKGIDEPIPAWNVVGNKQAPAFAAAGI